MKKMLVLSGYTDLPVLYAVNVTLGRLSRRDVTDQTLAADRPEQFTWTFDSEERLASFINSVESGELGPLTYKVFTRRAVA